MLYRCRCHSKRLRMAMRLYHRRSSATREKIPVQNGLSPAHALRLQSLGACGPRDSLSVVSRPRSQSLFPGSPNCLGIPPRSRSHSFSGAPRPPDPPLTEVEEEHIFQCYTRIMYIFLGGLAAFVMGLVLYGIRNFTPLSLF